MATHSEPALAATRFGARQRRGVLLGFSGPRLAALLIALMIAAFALFTAGIRGALITAPLAAVLLASAFVPIAGSTAVEWLPVAGHWAFRRALRQDVYGVRPLAPRPAGTLGLPGDSAALRVFTDAVSGAAMIHDPHRQTLTATCTITHPSFVLLGAEDQQRRVVGWGRTLAALARTGHIAGVQVMESTMPDEGTDVIQWWTANGDPQSGWAARTYSDFVASAAPSSARHRTTISLSLDMRRAARAISRAGRNLPGAAAVLRADMAALDSSLRSAELHLEGWVGAQDLARLIRSAYDADAGGTGHQEVGSAGPVGLREHWSWLEVDRWCAAVLWISEWPRSHAYPNFLHALVLAPGVRKSFSIVARPVPHAQARKEIRRQKVEYITDAEQKARIGQVADASDAAEYADVLKREEELAVGHADMRFAGLVAITAPDKNALDEAVAAIEQAAAQGECETRVLVGQQSQAFAAAALPLARGL